MTTTTGAHSNILAPGLRTIFFNSYREMDTEYTKFLNMQTSSRNYEDDYEMAGLGTMGTKPEGTATTYADPTPGSTKRYTHTSFGLGFRVTREAYDDDLYGPMRKMSTNLGRAGRNVREVRGANVLNDAFDTSVTGFKSSLSLCDRDHTLLKGGTAHNTPATQVDLSMAALEAAIISFDDLVDEDGIPMVMIPRRLLVPTASQFIAEELVGSEKQPESSNNAINPVARRGISVVVLHYLTDSDAWFLQGDQHDMNFIVRTDLEFQSGDDFDTGDAKFKAFQRFSTGFGDWRGIYGSSGAA